MADLRFVSAIRGNGKVEKSDMLQQLRIDRREPESRGGATRVVAGIVALLVLVALGTAGWW